MSECNIKLRHEGKSYPRTCAKCKLGPCQDGQDYAGLTARIRELEAQLADARAEGWRRAVENDFIRRRDALASIHVVKKRMMEEEGGWNVFLTEAINSIPASLPPDPRVAALGVRHD